MNNKILDQIKAIVGIESCGYFEDNNRTIIVKLKPQIPIFTTDDNVQIYDGDEYFPVYYSERWEKNFTYIAHYGMHLAADAKRFSTAKARDNYIFEQKKIELTAEALRRYPVGCIINQFPAYNYGVKTWTILHNTVDVSRNNPTNKDRINVTIGGIGVYNSDIGIWAPIVEPERKYLDASELVKGEIYVDEKQSEIRIVRLKSVSKECISLYSQLCLLNNKFYNGGGYPTSLIYPATIEQKQQLIKAEIEHDFFYELIK
jgi:hypothetical protein